MSTNLVHSPVTTTLTGNNYPDHQTQTGQYTTSFKRRDLYSVSTRIGVLQVLH